MLVQLNSVSKHFGASEVLREVSCQIYPGDKIGLIGANGAGKTTLLRILTRALEADSGEVTCKSSIQLGVLDQIPVFETAATVFEEALKASADLIRMETTMRDLEQQLSGPVPQATLDEYATLQHAFEIRGGYSYRAKTEAALQGVGFQRSAFQQPARSLSGGEKNRLALARLLLADADLLVLDEPTNHLDIRAIEWLERFLSETTTAAIIVSHDRYFLDRVVDRIFDLRNGRLDDYRGNYTDYRKERAERLARAEKEWEQQQEWIEKTEDFIRRNIAGQKTKQAQSRRNLLARTKILEKPPETRGSVKFRFVPTERSARQVLSFRELQIGYGTTSLVGGLNLDIQRGERWAILGANGSGKSTLLRTLIGQVSPVGGEFQWAEGLEVGYYDQQLADFAPGHTVIDEIRALDPVSTDGELRSFLGQFLFTGDDAFKLVSQLSGGEKSRLALARIIYECPTVLALDEPTNHLDIASCEALESALLSYPGTLLFVTHDRYLAQKIATHFIYLESGRAYTFDRFSALHEWLSEPTSAASVARPENRSSVGRSSPALSKNRRDQLQREIAALEERISAVEEAIHALESAFQNPPESLNWQDSQRQYEELKRESEQLYEELGRRLEIIG